MRVLITTASPPPRNITFTVEIEENNRAYTDALVCIRAKNTRPESQTIIAVLRHRVNTRDRALSYIY